MSWHVIIESELRPPRFSWSAQGPCFPSEQQAGLWGPSCGARREGQDDSHVAPQSPWHSPGASMSAGHQTKVSVGSTPFVFRRG